MDWGCRLKHLADLPSNFSASLFLQGKSLIPVVDPVRIYLSHVIIIAGCTLYLGLFKLSTCPWSHWLRAGVWSQDLELGEMGNVCIRPHGGAKKQDMATPASLDWNQTPNPGQSAEGLGRLLGCLENLTGLMWMGKEFSSWCGVTRICSHGAHW